jgi:uncharacterized protein (TIRG00374 family)
MDQEDAALSSRHQSSGGFLWRIIKQSIGYLIAVVGVIWVFHDVHFGRMLAVLTSIAWAWVILGVVFDILSYVCQGLRWSYVLRPLGEISLFRSVQAIYAGLFTNEILPMRIGELVRAFLVSRWLEIGFIQVISSLAVERLFDAIWLALAAGITVMLVPLPRHLVQAADILGMIAIVATGLFAYLVFGKRKSASIKAEMVSKSWKPFALLRTAFGHFRSGLQNIGTSRSFYIAFGVSVFIFIFQMISFWLVMRGCGVEKSVWVGAVVLLIVHLGTAIPNAPSNLGSYQFFCVLGLTLFGVDKTLAAGFSIVAFVVLTLPLWAMGIFAIGRTGMTLHQIRDAIRKRSQSS